MSWVPPDISQACIVHTTVTTCSSTTLLFLQFIASLFGKSRDSKFTTKQTSNNWNYHFSFPFSSPHSYSHEFERHRKDYDFGNQEIRQFLNPFDVKEANRDEIYDFVIVGAGSAGCVVANRLSEVHEWKILLLEAGGEEPDVARVPSFAPILQRSSIDWTYMTQQSQHNCRARPQKRCYWARGKVMGGSSTLNYMIYIRGGPKDYDEWAEMGNHGWSYRDVLPYFIKAEKNGAPEKTDPSYHGYHGYQSINFFSYQDKNVFHFIDAFRELGLPKIDHNAEENQVGVSLIQGSVHHGERISANSAFVRPIRNKRKNLTVRTNAHVTRVIFDATKNKATGIEYVKDGHVVTVQVKKEVILSAGTINSPKILMVSGIGPEKHLRKLGIKLVKDLPVGRNLQDHSTIDGVVFMLNKTVTTIDDDDLDSEVYDYKRTHKGPLSATGPLQIHAMVQTKYEDSHDRADIQYSFDALNVKNFLADPVLTAQTNVNPLAHYDGIMVRPILLTPESRGYILLNDTDPVHGTPLIYPNTYKEEIDILRIVEGAKQSLNLLDTRSLKKIGVRLATTPLPACKKYPFGSDDYWACLAVSYTATIYHPVGTCKMGPEYDKTAVVDPELVVHGVKNLRVIDASIMPTIPRGNTNGPTIMIGEKGSDLIKKRWLEDAHESNKEGYGDYENY